MTKLALAFDLGGTALRGALVESDGRIVAHASAPTLAGAGSEAVIGQIVALAGTLLREHPQANVAGIGVGAPGPLDPKAGIVIAPPTLAGWHDVPLIDILGQHFGLPVRLENDANAAALGEWRFGAGRGSGSLVFVTVSTGIGGGVVADGHIYHGRRGLAAEIGHMTITGEGDRCFCGAIGCFEAVASGTALGRRATRLTAPGDGSLLRRLSNDGDVSARHVVEAAKAGDANALDLIEAEAQWLGIGFTNLLHLYSPDLIVMGGGLSNGFDLLAPSIRAVIQQRAMPAYRDVPVVQAELGDRAGLIGAASLILREGEPGAPLAMAQDDKDRGATADATEARHG
ncbi:MULTISPECIES: ROK family protein [unclassified Mesorhizobium]|uniref:ROK family protein n=1 Tax=unclassified Mesorhizobium TaxID=325217 RepID=UPI0003CE9499|nr:MULTISPECIES: ROK family protein [unclassified Mesorhizobium]ESX18953.1 glucokinase [Mesorhizobium sp. LSJC255A00]ESX28973.1 glucokinase [Mesorhizobium sp. LSHC440B00]ESX34818.1 glucokinase [Mesorhizobium sp. LSHC432A00]ESX42730.1 glucokinase [Mesorhizobium sp. LSHC440A00]ESX73384.1 glucokinase [Mesorhizobium sp. LSHC414A00]